MREYHVELLHKIRQFTAYLKAMHGRAHEVAQGSCFIVFSEKRSDSGSNALTAKAAAKPPMELVTAGFHLAGVETITRVLPPEKVEVHGEGWKEGHGSSRYIQFSFEEKWFCVDIPRDTLYRAEAEAILRSRKGFFYLCDRPEWTLYQEEVEGHDPFRKIYLYGDEESAAEDIAYIFYQIWQFPVDWPMEVTACAFGGKATWEDGEPLGDKPKESPGNK